TIREKVPLHRLSDHDNVAGDVDIVRFKARPLGNRPIANVEVLGLGSGDGGRPVISFIDDLGAGLVDRSSGSHARNFALDRQHVLEYESFGRARAGTHAANIPAAAVDGDQVRAHSGNLLLRDFGRTA